MPKLASALPMKRGLEQPASEEKTRLRDKQARILTFLKDYTAWRSYPPTVREITDGCGLSSASVALYNLRILERKGYLTRKPGIARGIALTNRGREWPPPALVSSIMEDAA